MPIYTRSVMSNEYSAGDLAFLTCLAIPRVAKTNFPPQPGSNTTSLQRRRVPPHTVAPFVISSSLNSTSDLPRYEQGKAASAQGIHLPDVHIFQPGTVLTLPPAEQQHIRARRFRGGLVTVFNGFGAAALAELSSTGDSVIVSREIEIPRDIVSVTACYAAPKAASRADWAVEKLTELGVTRISCLRTVRGEAQPSSSKLQRWNRIAVAASKQSMGLILPIFDAFDGGVVDVRGVVENYDCALLLSPSGPPVIQQLESCHFRGDANSPASVLVVVGPEGGFTPEEEHTLIEGGCTPASLGARRLRVETAVVSAVASVRMFCDAKLRDK